MKPHEMPTGNGQSPVVPPLAPSGFLDAVSGGEVISFLKNKKNKRKA